MTRTLRVAHLDHTSTDGGAEYALLRMLNGPLSWNHRVVLPTASADERDIFTPHLEASRIRRLGPRQPAGASRSGQKLQSAALGARLLGQATTLRMSGVLGGADVVHANSTRSALYTAMALTGSRKPFVVHLRDMVAPESIGRVGFELFTRIALARADGVIANSSATLASAAPHIRSGTPTAVIASAAGLRRPTSHVSVRPEVRRVGMVARIDPWKGQELLLRAFADATLPVNARLVFAGSAPFGNEGFLQSLQTLAAELGVRDRVEFRGHVEDVVAFIDEMDMCVQSSLRPEPLGQNILQYLSRGAVVVAADSGGPLEWVKHNQNGALFKTGDLDSLTRALSTLAASQDLRSRLSRNAVDTPDLHSDAEIAELHAEFFRAVAGRRRSR